MTRKLALAAVPAHVPGFDTAIERVAAAGAVLSMAIAAGKPLPPDACAACRVLLQSIEDPFGSQIDTVLDGSAAILMLAEHNTGAEYRSGGLPLPAVKLIYDSLGEGSAGLEQAREGQR